MAFGRTGPYTLERLLDDSGRSLVFLGRDADGSEAVVKMLKPSLAADPFCVARFRHEVEALGAVTHHSVVRVLATGCTRDGLHWHATEYLGPVALDQHVAEHGPMSQGAVAYLIERLCGGVWELHRRRCGHNNISPENVIFSRHRRGLTSLTLIDFSSVERLGSHSAAGRVRARGTSRIVRDSVPAEKSIEADCDVHDIAALAYFMLTGADVRKDGDAYDRFPATVTSSTALRLRAGHDLEELLLECLEQIAPDRPRNARDFSDRLQHCRLGPAVIRSRHSPFFQRER